VVIAIPLFLNLLSLKYNIVKPVSKGHSKERKNSSILSMKGLLKSVLYLRVIFFLRWALTHV
jgi:hypothetical protein